jgi:hypothetical protein
MGHAYFSSIRTKEKKTPNQNSFVSPEMGIAMLIGFQDDANASKYFKSLL